MPRLDPHARIERPLSIFEYYHASLGISGGMVKPVEANFIFEGEGPDFQSEAWRDALDRACAANPGSRMRVAGNSWSARWIEHDWPAGLRIVDETDWDGMSADGAEFIGAVPLSVDHGPTVELVLVNRSPRGRLVIMRTPHAVMDGRGALHFLAEVFRALRGEPLLGTNAAFSDIDLMRRVKPLKRPSRPVRTDRLTGPPERGECGDEWRRITLHANGRNIVPRLAAAAAEYMHRHSDRPALFTVAVDLRRHCPELVSTANYFGVLFVPLNKGESAEDFGRRLRSQLEGRMDTHYPAIGNLVRLLPRRWIDRLMARYSGYNPRWRPLHTLGISNLGLVDQRVYSCDAFRMRTCFVLPLQGTNATLMGVGDRVEMVLNIPKAFAGSGRFDGLVAHLRHRLEA